MTDKETSTNASPSAFGYDFQACAGIVLFFDNLKKIDSIKIEGINDDIQLYCEDGNIYSQAKSCLTFGDDRSAKSKLTIALSSLENDNKKDKNAVMLIYTTNIPNVFGSSSKTRLPMDKSYSFNDLSDEDKKILKKINKNFPYEKFHIRTIEYSGEGETKYNSIIRIIEDFLNGTINDVSDRKIVFNSLHSLFNANAGDKPKKDKDFSMNKKKITYQIYIATEKQKYTNDYRDLDIDDDEELLSKYKNLIDKEIINFDFTCKIIEKFKEERDNKNPKNKNEFAKEFVNENYSDYITEFNVIKNEEERIQLVKYILFTIIKNRYRFEDIKEAANL